MDEPELEERLRRRLQARFDGQEVPETLHDRVIAALGSERPPSGRIGATRSVVVALRRQLLAVAAVVVLLLGATVVFWAETGSGPVGRPQASGSSQPVSQEPSPATYAGAFIATGSLATGRVGHSATLLANGKVLISGGSTGQLSLGSALPNLASAELYDPVTHAFSPTGSMTFARAGHTATLLRDGRVLIVGGAPSGGTGGAPVASAELYDPLTGTFTLTGSATVARQGASATLLVDGRVLIVGGSVANGSGPLAVASAELYDPATGAFSATGSMSTARTDHAAALLADGRVLIVGGLDVGNGKGGSLQTAELYDPRTGTFSPTGSMMSARLAPTATRLVNGQILVAGGLQLSGSTGVTLASAELYDPATGAFTPVGSMAGGRAGASATLLADGRVLIAGGADVTISTNTALASAELYDPQTGLFTLTGSLTAPREGQTATRLADGSVLLVGGAGDAATNGPAKATAELFR